MIETLPDVPPAFLLLQQELIACDSLESMRCCVKDMLRELRDQSEAFLFKHKSDANDSIDPLRIDMHLHGEMDILSHKGCFNFECRVKTAQRIARSFGLIADRVWMTDLLSEKFVFFGRPTKSKLDAVIDDVLVLTELQPLILAGIIRFKSPWFVSCSSCYETFENHVNMSAEQLSSIFSPEFHVEKRSDGGYFVDTGRCSVPNLVYHSTSSNVKRIPKPIKFAKEWIYEELRSALWTARDASIIGGAVVSNSRVGIAGLLQQDGRLADMNTLLLLDRKREFSIPWVNQLNAQQIVQLREEASSALPLFREKLARAMTIQNQDDISSTAPSKLITELREQALEVRAELEVTRKHSARYWKTTFGILGLGLSAYGIATDQILAGVGGLLPIINLLISHKTGYEKEISKLTLKPGYLLVKAQDLLSHSHES